MLSFLYASQIKKFKQVLTDSVIYAMILSVTDSVIPL